MGSTDTDYHRVDFRHTPGSGYDLVCSCGKRLGHAGTYQDAYALAARHERGEDDDEQG